MPFSKHLASSLHSSHLLTQHRNISVIGTGGQHHVHKGHPKPNQASLLHYVP